MSAGMAHNSKTALGLAVGTSAVLGAAAVTGRGLTPPEVVGAFGVAGVIAALNIRSNFPRRPHSLTPVPEVEGGVVINAVRARSMAAHPTAQVAPAPQSQPDAA